MLLPAVYVLFTSITCILFVPLNATADPEKAYQGGKSLSDSMLGKDHPMHNRGVDDRDFEQRARDAMKEAGARAGGGNSGGGRDSSGGRGSDSSSDRSGGRGGGGGHDRN